MKLTNDTSDLDSLLRDAEKERGLRPVPFGMHRKIENRIRLLALIQRERVWFVRSVTARGLAFVLFAGAFVLTTYWAGGFDARVTGLTPGGLGYLDYVATQCANAVSGLLDQPLWLAGIAAVSVVIVAAIPAKLYLRDRHV